MSFSAEIIEKAWQHANGHCECRRINHRHTYVRCNKELVKANRGREGRGAWEAHHIIAGGGDGLSNCEILCWECHKDTISFGRS